VLDYLNHIRTLILNDSAMPPYVQALFPGWTNDIGEWRCSKLDTRVIHSRCRDYSGEDVISTLCHIARERKLAGFPLRSVSLFLNRADDLGRPEFVDPELEELRGSIETFKLVVGDDVLDWNVDDHFLDGLNLVRED